MSFNRKHQKYRSALAAAEDLHRKVNGLEETLNELALEDPLNKPANQDFTSLKQITTDHKLLPNQLLLMQQLYTQSISMNLQKEIDVTLRIEDLPVLDPALADMIDDFQKLTFSPIQDSDLEKIHVIYQKIAAYCVSDRCQSPVLWLYNFNVNLEYAVRYYNLLVQAIATKIKLPAKMTLETQLDRIGEGIRYLIDFYPKNLSDPFPYFKISATSLMPPFFSKYLNPFLYDANAINIIVELADNQVATGAIESTAIIFSTGLANIKKSVLQKNMPKAEDLALLLLFLENKQNKQELIKSLAEPEEDKRYFNFVRTGPFWQALKFDEQIKYYANEKSKDDGLDYFIVFTKNLLHLKDYEGAFPINQFYVKIFEFCIEYADFFLPSPSKLASLTAAQIGFIKRYLLNACTYWLKETQEDNSIHSFFAAYHCFELAKTLPPHSASDALIKALEDRIQQLKQKFQQEFLDKEKIASEKLTELTLESEIEQKQREQRMAELENHRLLKKQAEDQAKWEKKTKKLQEEAKKEQAKIRLATPTPPPPTVSSDVQKCIQEIESLLQQNDYLSLEKLLNTLNKRGLLLEDNERILSETIEICLRKAEKTLKRIHLFAHFESSPATPISNEEHENIKIIQQLLSVAQKSCEQIKADKISEQGVIAADILHKKTNHIREKLNHHLIKFYHYCAYRKSMIIAANNYGKKDSGFASSLQHLTPAIVESVTRHIENLRKLNPATESDKDIRPHIKNDIQNMFWGFVQSGFTLIIQGGLPRDTLCEEEFRDIDLIAIGDQDPESFLRQRFGEGNFRKNRYRSNRYEAFSANRKYDIEFRPSQTNLSTIQVSLAENADCPANSLSFVFDKDGFHPIYDHTRSGITDAKNKIIDASNVKHLIANDAFIPLRYLDLMNNKNFISTYFFMSDSEHKQVSRNLIKRCQEAQEFGRLRSSFNKLFFNGHAKSAFKLLVRHGIIQQLFPEDFHLIQKKEKNFLTQLNEIDKRVAAGEKLGTETLNTLFAAMPKDAPKKHSGFIKFNYFQAVNPIIETKEKKPSAVTFRRR